MQLAQFRAALAGWGLLCAYDESSVAVANEKLKDLPGAKIEFIKSDAKTMSLDRESFDLTVCMGSSHAFAEGKSAFEGAIVFMQNILKPNGMILIGEGYWKREPDPEYLEFIGDPVGVYNSFEGNIGIAESAGFVPVYATESSLDEWDHFEWSFLLKAERAVISNPDNLDLRKKLDQVKAWNASYRKYGRSTMGYGHYVLMKK